MAVRDRDDEDDDRPRKKRLRASDEIEDDARPVKKRRPRDDDDEDERPRKRRRMDEDEDEGGDDLGNSPLGAVVPLGTSIWALLALYTSLISCIVPFLGLFSIVFGILAFVKNQHKATYGSITGNIRAVLGIVFGLVTVIGWSVAVIGFLATRR